MMVSNRDMTVTLPPGYSISCEMPLTNVFLRNTRCFFTSHISTSEVSG